MSRHPRRDEPEPTPGAIVTYRPIGSSDTALTPTAVVVTRVVRDPDTNERWVAVQWPVSGNGVRSEWITVACIRDVVPLTA